METYKQISVTDIYPDPNQPRKHFKETSIDELTESVKKHGILQSLVIRPAKNGYLLVFGERRFRAAKAAGLENVPANIRDLTDEEAMDMQLIENLQREDLHPMDEAVTFKSYMESNVRQYTIQDIAQKINKPESYVAHRLSLNNLIPELQKDFWNNKFLIGHAVMFSRLQPADQKLCHKECHDLNKEYKSLRDVQDFISRNIIRQISAAPFKRDDTTLNPEAGSCTSCHKRSGANRLLFDDIKEDDRCFDKTCFQKKLDCWTIKKVEDLLFSEKDVVLLSSSHEKILPEIVLKAKEYDAKILRENDDFYQFSTSGTTKAKGIWINSNKIGKSMDVHVKTKARTLTNSTGDQVSSVTHDTPPANDITEQINTIKHRIQRGLEIDQEKVYERILAAMKAHSTQKKLPPNLQRIPNPEWVALLFVVFDTVNYQLTDEIKRVCKIQDKTPGDLYFSLFNMTPEQITFMVRKVFLNKYSGNMPAQPYAYIIRKMAESYKDIPIAAYEKEQNEIRQKREARAAEKIKELQQQKKSAKPQPVKFAEEDV